MSSRGRILNALNLKKPDYVPCSFMLFRALRLKARNDYEYIENMVEMGLDAIAWLPINNMNQVSDFMDLNGFPNRIDPGVSINEWTENDPGESLTILHKEYITPEGVLKSEVRKTPDWPYYYHTPVMDDFLVPKSRSRKYLVEVKEDIKKLKYILTPPTKEDIKDFRENAEKMKKLAKKNDIALGGMWGIGMDAAGWLCGLENIMMLTIDDPGFVEEFAEFISIWNISRMEVFLDFGIDIFMRRGWYEGLDFWPSANFKKYIFPHLKKEVDICHEADTKFCHIITDKIPIDELIKAGVDAVVGVDPVMDKTMDLKSLKQKAQGKICLWGGVNQALTVELGDESGIKDAVKEAITVLGKDGGFILSPVENVIDVSEDVWKKVTMFIEAWKTLRSSI